MRQCWHMVFMGRYLTYPKQGFFNMWESYGSQGVCWNHVEHLSVASKYESTSPASPSYKCGRTPKEQNEQNKQTGTSFHISWIHRDMSEFSAHQIAERRRPAKEGPRGWPTTPGTRSNGTKRPSTGKLFNPFPLLLNLPQIIKTRVHL